ncbi:glutathione S-transferase [Aspergillus floccosus]
MAPLGLLYTFNFMPNPRAMKIMAVANMNNLELDVTPDFVLRRDNKTPEFLADYPMGKVPAFRAADGLKVFESDAIAQYVAESGPCYEQLLGHNITERTIIRQWICMANNEIMEPILPLVLWRVGRRVFDQKIETINLEKLERGLNCLEGHIKDRMWVATDVKLSLADISMASALYWGLKFVIDEEMRHVYPGIMAWYKRTLESEGVQEAFGEMDLIDKRLVQPQQD